MIKTSFFALKTPKLVYDPLTATPPTPVAIPSPKKVTLFSKQDQDPAGQQGIMLLATGETVKTGQTLPVFEDQVAHAVSPVTGTITRVSPYMDDSGQSYTAISIDPIETEAMDETFAELCKDPTLENIGGYLSVLPGKPPMEKLSNPDRPIHTIIVCGVDGDLFVTTSQFIVRSNINAIKNGISALKSLTHIENIVMVVPKEVVQGLGSIGAEVLAVDTSYPAALPHMIMKDVLGEVVPAGKQCEDLGVCFLTAEAVASIGIALNEGRLPFTKTLTLIKKDGSKSLVSTRIGTPIQDIFSSCNVALKDKDRIIIGGPMTGATIYSVDHPVQPDTDAIVVQDGDNLMPVSDTPCINCGECIRVCPVNIPVNMLIRFLEAGQYEEATEQYDLYSCIECGLCSFVCVSRIPIFQYIKLAKNELAMIRTAETDDVQPE